MKLNVMLLTKQEWCSWTRIAPEHSTLRTETASELTSYGLNSYQTVKNMYFYVFEVSRTTSVAPTQSEPWRKSK